MRGRRRPPKRASGFQPVRIAIRSKPATSRLRRIVRGAAPGMEQTLRALRGAGIDRRAEVLLADCGLTDEARRRAELLERSDAARICTPAELAQILQEEEECYGRAMHGGGNRTEHHLSE